MQGGRAVDLRPIELAQDVTDFHAGEICGGARFDLNDFGGLLADAAHQRHTEYRQRRLCRLRYAPKKIGIGGADFGSLRTTGNRHRYQCRGLAFEA
ncbi:MAG: hypothetical protein EBZ40_02305 [Gammaproteobacteria bacterium]|nr:hypothetical protein [Gammaproteobacteria bacterium]